MSNAPGGYDPNDILIGALAIAQFMWPGTGTAVQIHRMHATSDFPIFKLQGKLCARKSSIRLWIEQQEWRGKGAPGQPASSPDGNAPPAIATE